jgi:hypothetical protein
MLDSTRDLVLNYEFFYANYMATRYTIINGVINILRVSENAEWICTNIFRKLEVNFNGLYHDLVTLYRDVTNNHTIISRQISQVFVVLNRMYKGIKQMVVCTGKDIMDRIFESITIAYQQINQDMNTNTRTITSTFNNQFNSLSDTAISNFNILKIDFQTMDRNDQMILFSNNELKNNIQAQTSRINSMNENINNTLNVINYIFQETIAAFMNTQRKENEIQMINLQGNLMQGYNAIKWEIQNQRKEFNELFNEFDKFEIVEKNLSDTINSKFEIVKNDILIWGREQL